MLQNTITKKQHEIIVLLYRFRFLNRVQIQTLLQHKTPIRINTWLKDLTEKEYLTRIFKRSWTENSTPSKYYIGLQGIRFLKTQPDCKKEYLKKLYREKDRSQAFIKRCLFIADAYIRFLSDSKEKTDQYQFFTQQDLSPESLLREIKPDFVILKKKLKKQYFIYQLFAEGTPRYAIRKRIEQYIAFLTEGDGTAIPATLILLGETKTIADYLASHTTKLFEEDIDSLCQVYVFSTPFSKTFCLN